MSCVKVEVAVLVSPSRIVLMDSVNAVKQHLRKKVPARMSRLGPAVRRLVW